MNRSSGLLLVGLMLLVLSCASPRVSTNNEPPTVQTRAIASTNRCFLFGQSYWVRVTSGENPQSAQAVGLAHPDVDRALNELKRLQDLGLCPKANDPNNNICFIYSTGQHVIVSVGSSYDKSTPLFSGWHMDEATPIAQKLKLAGQCGDIRLGR